MTPTPANAVLHAYDTAIASGAITADPAQRAAATALDGLFTQLTAPGTAKRGVRALFAAKPTRPHGLYLCGDVGRGKSMLMDLFVATISPRMPTRRVHFHAFMLDIHKRLFAYRATARGEVMEQVITELARELRVLCLDELQVSDVTDAMILARLFSGLMDAGVTVLFTSNRRPRELYQGGLQRDQFLVFVDLLEARIPILTIDSPRDYRLAQLRAFKQTYLYPLGEAADDFLLESWAALTGGGANEPLRIAVDGRILRVDKQLHGIAWLTFDELCRRPLGANDYLELCNLCHTVILQAIPALTREDRNEAKRFVTLIDTLYDHRVKLIATAETEPQAIYEQGDGSFEFHRTVSRLMEMQSEAYLALPKI
ncbi:MAG: cell division protein ZapE [Pseudomonadota bacterium]